MRKSNGMDLWIRWILNRAKNEGAIDGDTCNGEFDNRR